MEMLTLEWRCFIEAAKHGSVSIAADHLHLPQPSVTKYVKRLEDELDTTLFIRSNRGVKLTESGEQLFHRLNGVPNQLLENVRLALQTKEEISGGVSLGSHRILALQYLPDRVATLYRQHPRLRIELRLGTSLETSRLVASGKLDYGLVANPIRLPGLIVKKCFEESVAVFSKKEIPITELDRIFYNPEMQMLPKILKRLRATQLEPVPDYEILSELAAKSPSTGALVPDPMAYRHGLLYRVGPVFYRATIALIFKATSVSARHKAIVESFATP